MCNWLDAYYYNRDNQLSKQTDPQGNISRYSYDKAGNHTYTTDAAGKVSRTVYDKLNRPQYIQQRVKGRYVSKQSNSYTATGQIETRKDGEGNTTTYHYDGHDQLKSVVYPNNKTEGYLYYPSGQVKQMTAPDNTVTHYKYDALGRLEEKQSGDDEKVVYKFNSKGQQYRTEQYLPASSKTAIKTTYTFDNLNRLKAVTDGNNRTLTYSYDTLNRRTSLTFPDNRQQTYEYDTEGRLQRLRLNGSLLSTHHYDSLSQPTKVEFSNGTRTQLNFEADGDIKTLTHHFRNNQTLGYQLTYNGAGQPTSKQHQGQAKAWLPRHSYTDSYTNNELNQSTKVGSDNVAFDDNGNLKTNVGLSYTHNALNQLTTITAQGISGSIRYQYDAQGRRTTKNVYGDTTQYLYDGEHVIAEYKNNQLIKRFIYATGTDNPIALISNNQTYYYHTDNIGSVVAISNGAGNIQEQYSYSPFGQSDDISLIGNPLRARSF